MDLADKEWNRRCVAACQWLKTEGDVGVRELAAIAGVPPYVVCFAKGMARAEELGPKDERIAEFEAKVRETERERDAFRLQAGLLEGVPVVELVEQLRSRLARAELAASNGNEHALRNQVMELQGQLAKAADLANDAQVKLREAESTILQLSQRLAVKAAGEALMERTGARKLFNRLSLPHGETDPNKRYQMPNPDGAAQEALAEVYAYRYYNARVPSERDMSAVLELAQGYLHLTAYELGQEHCVGNLRDIWGAKRATADEG